MATPCTICTHPEREVIDAIVARVDTGAAGSYSALARRYKVSRDALKRHRDNHLAIIDVDALPAPTGLDLAPVTVDPEQADDMVWRARQMQARVQAIMVAAEEAGKASLALTASKELRGWLQLESAVIGALKKPRQNIRIDSMVVHQEMQQAQRAIIAALAPYPEAKEAVLKALGGLGDGGS